MIRNLLFDLGGVIMDIDKNDCVRAFERLGLANASSYFGDYSQTGPFMLLEEGAISPDEFHAALRADLPDGVSDAQIDAAFCEFLTGIPPYRLQWLRDLRKQKRVYMLSNTNPVMWHSKIAREFEQEGGSLSDYFDGCVTSFEAKALKPEKKIFDYAIRTLGIKPEETLFLDDSESNVQAARALGFQAEVVPPGTEFMDILRANI